MYFHRIHRQVTILITAVTQHKVPAVIRPLHQEHVVLVLPAAAAAAAAPLQGQHGMARDKFTQINLTHKIYGVAGGCYSTLKLLP